MYAVYSLDTGALVSTGSVEPVASTLTTNGLGVVEYEPSGKLWDAVTRSFSVEPVKAVRVFTRIDFILRFDQVEYHAMKKSEDEAVEYFYDIVLAADTIPMDSPHVLPGLQYLESVGILAPGRVTEIMEGE